MSIRPGQHERTVVHTRRVVGLHIDDVQRHSSVGRGADERLDVRDRIETQ
jgi:hypothetical protein